MIKIDTRYPETLIFDTAFAGVRDTSTVLFRLFMSITDGFNIVLTGNHNSTELIFTIPPLRDFVNVQDKQQVPFHIEALIDDYTQTIMESEMELLNPPEITIDKITQLKKERNEEVKPIKIDEVIQIKEKSKFQKGFEIFLGEANINEK